MIIRATKDLGRLIRERRRLKGLTQAQLAVSVGASRKWIVELEAGKRTAELSLALRTLNALGLLVDVRERTNRDATEAINIDAIVEGAKTRR